MGVLLDGLSAAGDGEKVPSVVKWVMTDDLAFSRAALYTDFSVYKVTLSLSDSLHSAYMHCCAIN